VRTRAASALPAGIGRLRLGAALALALAGAFVVWLVVRPDEQAPAPTAVESTAAPPAATATKRVVLPATVETLKALAALTPHPIYWAGPQARVTYELTQTPNGRLFIRYLPRGADIGDTRARFLIVGTYPVRDAYRAIETAAAADGAVKFRIARRGLAVYNRSLATNVYFAYPGSRYQVEVYDPDPRRARSLVRSGAIRPIG
jgi:hypothetical protein